MHRRRSARRRALSFVALFGLLVTMSATWSGEGGAATQPSSMLLKGAGSWGAYREILTWQDELSGSKSPVDLSYAAHGTYLGRQDLISGSVDFVLSAIPFSADELTQVPGGAGVIGAPVQVSSLTALLQRPVPDGFLTLELLCDPDDPNVPDPSACVVRTPYEGPVRIPHDNLAAMLLRYAGGTAPPYSSWNHPGVLSAMGVANFTTPPLAGPAPVTRSEQDEFNYYLQQYVAQAAPSVWSGLKAQETRIQWEPITERLGRQASASRDGVEQQGQQLALGGGDPGSGTISGFTAGVIAPVPASAIGAVRATFPAAKIEFVEVQNANGDWVAPTPESINLAVEAGGEQPLYALTNQVPGAYPLAWVDYLYAPAKGLSAAKAEALATVIRYLATAGQKAAQPVGEGKLSDTLATKALAAADALVRSNCAGNVVESSDPGPFAPDVAEMKAIGTMAHCSADAVAASTPPPSDGTSFSSYDYSSGGSTTNAGTSNSVATAAPATTGAVESDTPKRTAALAATKLPLPYPSSTSGVDRLATLALGAVLYLLLRRPIRKLLVRGNPT